MTSTSLVRQLGALFAGGSAAGLSDRQLLERFVAGHDPAGEAAFAALVARHGPMVLGICRQLLGDHQHAEDAFQAVFLVLARKARSLREPELLGNWLYGVALRTARKARGRLARRRRTEVEGSARYSAMPPAAPADRELLDSEQAEVLHGEIDRLPRAFRLPLVLCYFEGLSHDEAAHRLQWPVGTVRSRLARARDKLRLKLARRGVAVPAVAAGAALAPRSASASVSSLLCETTTRAAIAFAARHAAAGGALSSPIAALAQEVLNTMLIHKLRLVAMTVLALAGVATGAGYLALALAGSREGEPPGEPMVRAARAEPRPPDPPAPAEGRMTVAGRVLDPAGKPVAGAAVDLVARRRTPRVGTSDEGDDYALLAQGRTDADGRYRLDAPRTASNPRLRGPRDSRRAGVRARLGRAERRRRATFRRDHAPARAGGPRRLVDVTGEPAKGVEVRVSGVWRPNANHEGRADGVSVGVNPPEGLRTWPKAVKTDDQGRIAVSGIGRGVNVGLQVRDLRYARQGLSIDAARATAGQETTASLQPAHLIEGRVLTADTGSPMPNAIVSVETLVKNGNALGISHIRFRADARGHFVLNLAASEHYTLTAIPSGGEPYLPGQVELKWTKGAVKASRDIKVRRGVAIRGKVSEQGTGRPLAGSSIQRIAVRGRDVITWGSGSIVASREDGSFQLAVPPGKGHLIVFGPTPDYVLGEIGFNRLHEDRPGGTRCRAPAIIPYEVKAGDPPHEVAAVLRPGVTIRGRIEGPGGETVTDAFILTTLHAHAGRPSWDGQSRVPIRDGRFELHGLDPNGTARISILDPEHEWGATLELSGKQAGEDTMIRLQPCGRAKARFVGPDGQPIAGHWPMIEFVATPGPSEHSLNARDQAELLADAEMLVNLDRKHYWNSPKTDAEGRITLPALIPGALYRITDFSTVNDDAKGPQVRKDFTVRPGETLDLGDIRIEKPAAG